MPSSGWSSPAAVSGGSPVARLNPVRVQDSEAKGPPPGERKVAPSATAAQKAWECAPVAALIDGTPKWTYQS
jgi:hypothetical protein